MAKTTIEIEKRQRLSGIPSLGLSNLDFVSVYVSWRHVRSTPSRGHRSAIPSPDIPSDDEGVTRPTEHLFSTPEWIRRTLSFPFSPIPSKNLSIPFLPFRVSAALHFQNDTRHAKFHSWKRSFSFLYIYIVSYESNFHSYV